MGRRRADRRVARRHPLSVPRGDAARPADPADWPEARRAGRRRRSDGAVLGGDTARPLLGLASGHLVQLTRDPDANVRAAAVEAIGEQGDPTGLAAVCERLRDDTWFVRVHACRAVGRLGDLDDAPRIAAALGDPWWWVRTAAKDALRGFGIGVAGALMPYLDDADAFVRNGAAEVLQDVGFVDALSLHDANGALLSVSSPRAARASATPLCRG